MTAELALCSIVNLQNQAKQTQLISCPPISNSNELSTLSASARLALRIPVACACSATAQPGKLHNCLDDTPKNIA